MIILEIYNSDNETDFNNTNLEFLNIVKEANLVPDNTREYAAMVYVNRITNKIGLPLKSEWSDLIKSKLSDEKLNKIITIDNENNPDYFPIIKNKNVEN